MKKKDDRKVCECVWKRSEEAEREKNKITKLSWKLYWERVTKIDEFSGKKGRFIVKSETIELYSFFNTSWKYFQVLFWVQFREGEIPTHPLCSTKKQFRTKHPPPKGGVAALKWIQNI